MVVTAKKLMLLAVCNVGDRLFIVEGALATVLFYNLAEVLLFLELAANTMNVILQGNRSMSVNKLDRIDLFPLVMFSQWHYWSFDWPLVRLESQWTTAIGFFFMSFPIT